MIAYIVTPLTCFAALGVGWWLRGRRLGALGLTDEQIVAMVKEFQQVQTGVAGKLGEHSKRIEQINDQFAANQSGAEGAPDPIASGLFEQILEANEDLHQQLAKAERRIRELSASVGAIMPAERVDVNDATSLKRTDSAAPQPKQRASTPPGAAPLPSSITERKSAASSIRADVEESAPAPINEHSEDIEDETEAWASCEDRRSANSAAPVEAQRVHERRTLMKEVLLAPYVEGSFPMPEDFRSAKGFDISEGGISFFLPNPPTHELYVVVLGQAPNFIYMKARVVRVANKHMYLVGCRFMGRMIAPVVELALDDTRR